MTNLQMNQKRKEKVKRRERKAAGIEKAKRKAEKVENILQLLVIDTDDYDEEYLIFWRFNKLIIFPSGFYCFRIHCRVLNR